MTHPPRSSRTPQQALRLAYLQLIGLVIFWALNFFIVSAALGDIGPIALAATRFSGAALIFALLCLISGAPLAPPKGQRLPLALIGMLQIGVGSVLTSVGLLFVPPGRASVLVYTMQLWALALGYLLSGDRLSRTALGGLAVSTLGLVLFLSPWQMDWSDPRALIGYGVLLLVAMVWALGSTLYRRIPWHAPPFTQTLWQVVFSAIFAAILWPFFEAGQSVRFSAPVWIAILYNAVIASGLCFVWWNDVIKSMPAAIAGQFVSITPIVVLLASSLWTGESLGLMVVVSAALMTAGIIFSARGALRGP